MKKERYISLLLLSIEVCVGLMSCGSGDNDELQTGITHIIVGEWDSEFLGESSYINTKDLNVNDTQLSTIDSRLVFNSNGKGYEIDMWDNTKTEFTYTVNGNTIKMSGGGVSQIHKIIKYSDNVIYSLVESEQSVFKIVRRK